MSREAIRMNVDGRETLRFTEGNKTLLFSIPDYQYHIDDLKEEDRHMYYGDANWLMVRIDYTDENGTRTYEDPCLETYDLGGIVKDLQGIIDGKETGCIIDFMEPELHIAITKVFDGLFGFMILFYYDLCKGGWKSVYVSRGMDLDDLKEMAAGFREIGRQFPEIKFPNKKEAD